MSLTDVYFHFTEGTWVAFSGSDPHWGITANRPYRISSIDGSGTPIIDTEDGKQFILLPPSWGRLGGRIVAAAFVRGADPRTRAIADGLMRFNAVPADTTADDLAEVLVGLANAAVLSLDKERAAIMSDRAVLDDGTTLAALFDRMTDLAFSNRPYLPVPMQDDLVRLSLLEPQAYSPERHGESEGFVEGETVLGYTLRGASLVSKAQIAKASGDIRLGSGSDDADS